MSQPLPSTSVHQRRDPGETSFLLKDLDMPSFIRQCKWTKRPRIQTPEQVGYFSLDCDHNFRADNSELKYLKLPPDPNNVQFDLNLAYDEAVKREFGIDDANIDDLLFWIVENSNKLREGAGQISRCPRLWDADFICYRGVLTNVLCSPYQIFDGWIVCATKFAGNIYLLRLLTEKQEQGEWASSDRGRRMVSWGYKFEQYMTSGTPYSCQEDPSVPVNENCHFVSVTRTQINNLSILFSAEMDGLRPEFADAQKQDVSSMAGYVEMKTCKIVEDAKEERKLHRKPSPLLRKMLKWWAQSFIAGVPTVYCGFRDDSGIVHHVRDYSTLEIPNMVQNIWNPEVCMKFLVAFLDLVKQCVVKDNPRVVYKFEWYPGQQISCQELNQDIPQQFLPDWYISDVEARLRRQSTP